MKNIKENYLLFTLSTASLLFTTTIANANITREISVSPYLGADAQIRNINYPHDFGGNVYKKNHPQVNAFGGLSFNNYFSIEGGYELTPVKTNTVAIGAGQNLFGNPVGPLFPPVLLTSKFQVKDWNVNMLGFLPLTEDCHLQLVGGAGFARTKLFQSTYMVSDRISPVVPFTYTRTFIAKKGLLRLTGGLQHMVSESYGVRILTNWINTSRFKKITSKESATDQIMIKNSWNYGVGLFVKF